MDINRPLSFARISFGGKEIAGQKVSVSTGIAAAAAGSPYLDFGARVYDPRTAAWLSQDPLSEKYYSISPYAYCAGNPVNLVDPTGMSTWVTQNADGTYSVVGGDLYDDDLGIYLALGEEGNWQKGTEKIGETMTMTSFYNADDEYNEWMIGAKIDLNDYSGISFINKMTSIPPPLLYYSYYAYPRRKYDFKVTNGEDKQYSSVIDYYRGMPFKNDKKGGLIIASARDIGNYVAGYQAGARGILWSTARIAFDALESIQNRRMKSEGSGTQEAEYWGWKDGRHSIFGITSSILRAFQPY